MSLLPYQEAHAATLEEALKQTCQCAIDASDTGTGKTYVAAALAKRLQLGVVVVCPKSVLISWQRVLQQFGVTIYGIANYELIKGGSWYTDVIGDIKEPCLFTEKNPDYKKGDWKWRWNTTKLSTENVLFIFDEVHRCKNVNTVNAKMLLALAGQPCKKLLLSATIADKVPYFAVFAKMLGFIGTADEFGLFLKKLKYGGSGSTKPSIAQHAKILTDAAATHDMLVLHRMIFPSHGSRMKISDLKGVFPDNRVIADTYKMDDDTVAEIKKQYDYISAVHTEAEAREALAVCPLTIILRARQKIEALKVKTIAELVVDHLANGDSVAVFVNYLDTMRLLQSQLSDLGQPVKCVIKGGQTTEERQNMIDLFNEDKERVIICQIQSGGVGISLHDTIGAHPRVSIISPSWSAQDLMQAFGRIHRASGKTPCIQKLVYCHGTVEEHICGILNKKLLNYALLNDGGTMRQAAES